MSIIFICFCLFFPILAFFFLSFGGRWFGRNGVFIIGVCLLMGAFLGVIFCSGRGDLVYVVSIYGPNWVGREVWWGLLFDLVGVEMVGLVLTITLCVFVYSTEYMGHDPHLVRFLSYLCLFGFFMIVLVTAPSMVQLFIGWEGVGMVSFLLINFWWMRLEANRSAIKAMLFNRVGDSFYLAALVGSFGLFGTGEINSLLFLDSVGLGTFINNGQELIALGFLLAAVGKSAQIGLHAWLPDAMEGPTPVSSLLHSATMVTAGVFLLVRFFDLIGHTFVAELAAMFGCITALINAVWGFFQWDLKKIIAFSTCSQLGLMVVAVVLDGRLGFYHLMNHGFFKALLFLSAGAVIHGVSNEQDIRKMGGLFYYLPVTGCSMLVGSLALAGFPFLSGFYSKERILFGLFSGNIGLGLLLFVCLFLTSLFTVLYSIKILMVVFWCPEIRISSKQVGVFVSEPSFLMLLPMFGLVFLSLIFGFFSEGLFVGPGCVRFEFIPLEVVGPSYKWFLVILFFYVIVCWGEFFRAIILRINCRGYVIALSRWLVGNKLGFTSIYRTLSKFVLSQAYSVSFVLLDRGVWEQVGSTGLVRVFKHLALQLFNYQRSDFGFYLFEFGIVCFGIVLSIFWGFGFLFIVYLGFFIVKRFSFAS